MSLKQGNEKADIGTTGTTGSGKSTEGGQWSFLPKASEIPDANFDTQFRGTKDDRGQVADNTKSPYDHLPDNTKSGLRRRGKK